MYKYEDKQITIDEFEQPVGMHLKAENRWVKKAMMIPWGEIESRYAKLFTNNKGNVVKSLHLALGACIIQAEYGYSDEETALQIQEGAYLQYFCGYKAYDDSKLPFDPSLMVYFRKRLTPAILGEINEMIIAKAQQESKKNDKNDKGNRPEPPSNSGTMIVDATCAPSQISYPQDTKLLNDARESTEEFIDALHDAGEEKPRTYRKRARKDYLAIVRNRKPTAKMIRKAIGKQLGYIRRNLGNIEKMLSEGRKLTSRQNERLDTVRKVYNQQKYMYENHTHSVSDRIVSLNQPWIRPIVRGKAKTPVEFGAKLDISVVNGWTRLEYQSFDAYNESTKMVEMVERYRERTGSYPQRVLADKIYRNRENLRYCAEKGIHLSGPALGRPKANEKRDRKQDYIDVCERVEVERRFSLAKRKCGLGLIVTKLSETARHCVAMSIIVLNLRKVLRAFFTFLDEIFESLIYQIFQQKNAFVQ